MALNRVEIIGNLGADPEIRSTQSGDKCANLRVAVSEKWKDRNTGERRERTEWVPVVIWGPLAGIAEQYLRKGSKVFIAGKFTTRKWQDQSGQDRYSTEVVVQGPQAQMVMLDSPASQQQSDQHPNNGGRGYQAPASGGVVDDEIPF